MRVAWTEMMTEKYCTTLADSMDGSYGSYGSCVVLTLAMDSLPPSLLFALRCCGKNNTL